MFLLHFAIFISINIVTPIRKTRTENGQFMPGLTWKWTQKLVGHLVHRAMKETEPTRERPKEYGDSMGNA
jgi:hypothetical protein